MQVQYHRKIKPTLLGPNIADVTGPFLVIPALYRTARLPAGVWWGFVIRALLLRQGRHMIAPSIQSLSPLVQVGVAVINRSHATHCPAFVV